MNDSDPIAALDAIARPAMVASHFRSGTHLLMDLIRRQFRPFRPSMRPFESIHATYLSLDRFDDNNHRPIEPAGALELLRKATRSTLKTHALPSFDRVRAEVRPFHAALVERSTALYAVRDGRDVLCSMHAWMRSFRDEPEADFEAFCFDPLPHSGVSRAREWNDHVLAWLDRPATHTVRFERIVKDTRSVLDELGTILGEQPAHRAPLLPRPIKSVRAAWLARALGRVESTNVHSGGIPPLKRAEAFDDRSNQRFLDDAGEATERLGYAP